MFDADYFNTHHYQQMSELGGSAAACKIVLHNGTSFTLRKLASAEANYLLAEVYPLNLDESDRVSIQAEFDKRKNPAGEVDFDKVAISYESIAYVLATRATTDPKSELGFHTIATNVRATRK